MMLRIIHPNGGYTEYGKDEKGNVYVGWRGLSDLLSAGELFDDIAAALASGARVELVPHGGGDDLDAHV